MSVPTKIEFLEVNYGKIRAFATVHYGDFVMRGFKIVEPDGKPMFVSMPSKKLDKRDDDEETRWVNTVVMPDEGRKKAFEEFVLKAWRAAPAEASPPAATPRRTSAA